MYDVYFKESGWEFASKPFDEIAAPIKEDEWFGCSTCHDPDTMQLRVYNQGFVESMAEMGAFICRSLMGSTPNPNLNIITTGTPKDSRAIGLIPTARLAC